MLADGEIDVLFTAYGFPSILVLAAQSGAAKLTTLPFLRTRPSTYETSDNVEYLFPNFKEVEKGASNFVN